MVIYARASSDSKGRKISVASQIEIGRKWCEQVGATVVAVLVDNDLSASRYATETRGDYEEALRLLATGQANCLWTWENSRAQRDMKVFMRLRGLLEELGGYWAYDERVYDLTDADDRIAVTEDAVDAERESEKLRKRVLRGVEARAMSGLWAGPLSYGYRVVYDQDTGDAQREIDESTYLHAREIVLTLTETRNESALAKDLERRGIPCARATQWRADHVKKLYALSQDAEGWAKFIASLEPEQVDSAYEALVRLRTESASQVAKDMNKGHWAHPLPGRWSAGKVRNIGLNPALAGLRVFRGKVIGKGTWDAIITEEEHDNVVAALGNPNRENVKDGDRVKYLLTGILLCGKCDTGVSTSLRKGKMTYRCNTGHVVRNMAKTDSVVVERVLRRLSSEADQELFQYEGQAKELTAAIQLAQDLRARLDGFTDKAAEGELSPERLARIEQKLVPRIKEAEARARQIGVAPAVAKLVGPDAAAVWETLSVRQKREVIRALVRPRLLPTTGGAAPFNPDHVRMSWLGQPAQIPGVDYEVEDDAAA
ncbi:recombinase family protein [Amycolatopsis rubida]|uniref:Recombinase family protein n=1 Tax=Amycolatopsis rubida TaxID=112413 RepID=A0ABX0C0Y6_9PSEU|nr:recombinase family protein [Amycolatopsis sp. M39]MYW95993.1 recombinase family protein [Amycolatopsis rubida]NEC60984.1 recombinase family protein [Amycolatopsis rubida]